ncbi:MAG: AraC family transcriptional regulator [Fluviicoccus sp.]|uniref:AraC family transcriptional regulator n=1 Tax=Fluviicoccus sp. TaxID=2003552 RepID=UPI00271D5B23|nr:AraC family transcriptional regulator [Fluviicoccus sp.]MDO8331192.1 AraC family transcriptional regulator [Fluviicoccus sp.]
MHDSPSLPMVYALFIVDIVSRWGVSDEQMLEGTGLTREMMLEPQRRLALEDFNTMIIRARDLTGETALAMHFGVTMQVSLHGFVGFAAMTAATVREALTVAERFIGMISTAFELRLEEGPQEASLTIIPHTTLQPLREAAIICLIFGFVHMGQTVTGKTLSGRAQVEFDEPPYLEPIKPYLPGPVDFGQPVNRLVFPTSYLDLPLIMANPVASQMAMTQCEQDLRRFGLDKPFVAQVKALMYDERRGFATLEQVAERLHMSERTLKRQLAGNQVAYSDLVEEARKQMATDLLEGSPASLEDIAEKLGYSDVANFSRAFKRWTGATPNSWRKGARGS